MIAVTEPSSRSRSSALTRFAVITMTGIRAVSARSRSASTTSKPFTDRHHQVEHDEPGQLRAGEIDRLLATVCPEDGRPDRREPDGDQLHRLGIVVDHQHRERLPFDGREQSELRE